MMTQEIKDLVADIPKAAAILADDIRCEVPGTEYDEHGEGLKTLSEYLDGVSQSSHTDEEIQYFVDEIAEYSNGLSQHLEHMQSHKMLAFIAEAERITSMARMASGLLEVAL